ncbi:membrane protein [Bacillus phage Nachito]|nr:membrane protein [Bacillus phage Nachito]
MIFGGGAGSKKEEAKWIVLICLAGVVWVLTRPVAIMRRLWRW